MNFASKILAAVILSVAAPALAQEPPAPIWSGFYIGAYGGSVSGSSKSTLLHNDPLAPGETATTVFGSDAGPNISLNGGTGALALGYNWQSGFLVYGVEADMAWVGATGSGTIVSTDTNTTWRLDTKLYSLGTLRGRVGVATGPVLWYGTAGLAWGLVESKNRVSCAGCSADPWSEGKATASHLGYVAGGGAEWIIGPYVVLRAEYLFADLGTAKHDFRGTSHAGTVPDQSHPGLFVYDWDGIRPDLSFQMWRAGVSFKFN